MKAFRLLSPLLPLVCFFLLCFQWHTVTAWVSPIEVSSYKFWNSQSGQEFIGKGIVFYPNANKGIYAEAGVDIFTDDLENIWRPHLENLKELGVNLIRIYAVNPTVSHDRFMCEMSKLGIYVLLEVSATCENCSVDVIKRAPDCYHPDLKKRAQMIINAFIKYPNVLGFSAGNEINYHTSEYKNMTLSDTLPCLKALVKDMRKYIAGCPNCRRVPVGIVASNQPPHNEIAQYFGCQETPKGLDNVEWYGINPYIYCEPSVKEYAGSTWNDHATLMRGTGLSVPIVAAEYGCVSPWDGQGKFHFPSLKGDDGLTYENQRTWTQTGWLTGNQELHKVYQAGIAYSYSVLSYGGKNKFPYTVAGQDNYGIGYPSPETCDHVNTKCNYVKKPEFQVFAQQIKANTLSGNQLQTKSSFTPDPAAPTSPPACPAIYPAVSSFKWAADSIQDLPYAADTAPCCTGSQDADPSVVCPQTTAPSTTKNGGSTSNRRGDNPASGGQTPDSTDAKDTSSSGSSIRRIGGFHWAILALCGLLLIVLLQPIYH